MRRMIGTLAIGAILGASAAGATLASAQDGASDSGRRYVATVRDGGRLTEDDVANGRLVGFRRLEDGTLKLTFRVGAY